MKTTTRSLYQERMSQVLARIQEGLDQPLSLESLAAEAFFSPTHFHRIFKGMFGETLMDHIRRLRLERAARALRDTRRPVTDLAFDAGYETLESFSRAFKAMTGLSPSAFRRARAWPAIQPPTQGDRPVNVTIQNLPAMKGVSVRHTGPYRDCGRAWQTLCAWAGPRGLLRPDSLLLGIGHDDPTITPPEKIRYDAVIVVDREVPPEGEIRPVDIPGGEYAVLRHLGPYEGLEQSYADLMGRWLPTSGREMDPASPGFEVYRNSPENTPPAELVTDIHVRLLPA